MRNTYLNPRSLIFLSAFTLIAYLAAPFIPMVNSVILGLLLGILLGNLNILNNEVARAVTLTSSRILEIAIVFLAFSINYRQLIDVGANGIILVMIMIVLVLLLSKGLSRLFNCNTSTARLIAFGTAICGSSAIAALAPMVSKEKEDTGVALAVVNLMGTLGMIILPLVLVSFGLSEHQEGLFLGSSLHSVGNVAGAAYAISNTVGETAITVKMARVAMLSPVLLITSILNNRKSGVKGSGFKFPWYLIAFIAVTVINSLISLPESAISVLEESGKIALTAAMLGIGYGIKFKQLINSGKKGLLFGLALFILQLIVVSSLVYLLA